MVEFWFGVASVMVALYVVMDGFDFGAGALHLHVAKTDEERRQVLAAIGPFWDGNEVFLLAGGGVLFVAFPAVLASGLSGFYFAIFLVLWTLLLRGIAIEFRSHIEQPLWRSLWDAAFCAASATLPILFGAALGNLLRGLPIDERGWFSLPLFTNFTTSGAVGILDWYTVLVGVFALVAILGHGALFLAWKTDGPVHVRSRAVAVATYGAVAVLWPVVTLATGWVNPALYEVIPGRPLAWITLVVALGGIVTVGRGLRGGNSLAAFAGSAAFLLGLLAATAVCVYPVMLRSSLNDAWSITAHGAAVAESSLRTAMAWWLVAAPLVAAYFVVNFRLHRGKVKAAVGREGY